MSSPQGPFQPIHRIGGQYSGTPFATCKWVQGSQAAVVKGLRVWYNSSYLRGIQVTYSDDSRSPVYGKADDSSKSITLAPGERITSLTLWGNGVGTRTGRISLTTTGQSLDAGKNTSGQTAYDIDLGSGILVGFVGRHGSDIDQLGAVFLRSAITRVIVTNVVYNPDLAGKSDGIQNVSLDTAQYSNDKNKQITWNFGGSTSRSKSTTYSQTSGNIYGVSVGVEVSAEPFGIGVKASGGFEWKHEESQTTGTSVTSDVTFNWGLSGTLEPGESCTCTALVQRGEGSTNYTAKVTVKLDDGTTNSFSERGVFQNIAYTKVQVKVDNQQKKRVSEFMVQQIAESSE